MKSTLKKSSFRYFISGIIAGLILVLIIYKPFGGRKSPVDADYYQVVRVIDGDTIRLDNDEVVRLIGVDTPESTHPELPVQLFAKEAADFTRRLCEGLKVRLEFGEDREDKYGRLLAYVYLEDGRMINEELIKRGYAYVLRRFPFKKKDKFLYLQSEARSQQRGLWSYNLSAGRLAAIAERFEGLSEEGKAEFDIMLDKLEEEYSQESYKQ